MYLKDCLFIIYKSLTKSCEIKHCPFAFKLGDWSIITGLTRLGETKISISQSNPFLIDFKGTPISDRDYRLAVARAKALQNQKS